MGSSVETLARSRPLLKRRIPRFLISHVLRTVRLLYPDRSFHQLPRQLLRFWMLWFAEIGCRLVLRTRKWRPASDSAAPFLFYTTRRLKSSPPGSFLDLSNDLDFLNGMARPPKPPFEPQSGVLRKFLYFPGFVSCSMSSTRRAFFPLLPLCLESLPPFLAAKDANIFQRYPHGSNQTEISSFVPPAGVHILAVYLPPPSRVLRQKWSFEALDPT